MKTHGATHPCLRPFEKVAGQRITLIHPPRSPEENGGAILNKFDVQMAHVSRVEDKDKRPRGDEGRRVT
ncbi:hypothetical protein PoB_005010800 [Plakobranchus ocellatus]|uniref:Uncharacterized protein n=1 Tax=Plakobranchus ocellatus TaxID=259542 RepID=A0AAV4BVH9_9GAST|nr:hypothetical protein PoB_005010800 [Plakobranchus ocellatus]